MKTQHRQSHYLRLIIAIILMTASYAARAQHEPMFTQYMFNETFINPAYAGSHDGVSLSGLYRNQWVGIEGSPKTQTLCVHSPVKRRKFGLGLSMMNESIGVTDQFLLSGNFAYRIVMPSSVFAMGLQAGFVNDQEKYTLVKSNMPGDDQFVTDVHKYFLPNAGFGLYYYYKKKFYAGFSVPRLIENRIDPSSPDAVVRNVGNLSIWHYYLASGYVFDLDQNVKFKPSFMLKAVKNAPLELDLNMNFLFNDLIWLGASYRTGDAVSALLGVQINKQLRMGYSYDFTLSNLQRYNSGSHEFSISYEFASKKHRVVSTRYF